MAYCNNCVNVNYTKPSEKRAKAKKAGIARWKKKQALSDEFAPASARTNKKTKKR